LAGHNASLAARAKKLILQDDSTVFVSPARLHWKFSFRFSEKCVSLSASRSTKRGVSADRHERWVRDAMDVLARNDEARRGGWQKRVVLIARCRDQVCRIGDVCLRARHAGIRQATVAKKARTPRRARHKP
jgi:hypothetical protein